MRTDFTAEQLADPGIARSETILRRCVHCGFCTATCPTYLILGNELDSPRGRIYLIKQMLESGRPADRKTVLHIDRCLSCLSCMTTCPSDVNYMHLVDHARAYIEETYQRPLLDRILRWTLAQILPYPMRFRLAILGAWMGKPFRNLLPDPRLRAMLDMAPASLPPVSTDDDPQVIPALGTRKWRVALMNGCAQKALNTDINAATIRILTRLGCDVVIAQGAGCCGALSHHMGKADASHRFALNNIKAWLAEDDRDPLDAIIVNASGCGTTVKDYGHMFADDERHATMADRFAGITLDITEFLDRIGLPDCPKQPWVVCYHSACSLQHGQRVTDLPQRLLKSGGFDVVTPHEGHICCGSAGTYNLLQPELAAQLRQRKVANIAATGADLVATGNIGCLMQIQNGAGRPVVHTVELLDYATGGPLPPALAVANAFDNTNNQEK